MIKRSLSIIQFHSEFIVRFVDAHPINWSDRNLARRGGAGDMAGTPPISSVEMFLALLRESHALFDQADYFGYCKRRWNEFEDRPDWFDRLPGIQQKGLEAKAFRNFYPSMIDSLHAHAILSESGLVDVCLMNSTDDVLSKVDLTVSHGDRSASVALIGPTPRAFECRQHKRKHRNGGVIDDLSVCVQMPRSRKVRRPGNKRWHEIGDFDLVFNVLFNMSSAPDAETVTSNGHVSQETFDQLYTT